ncbi:MAG: ArsR/SmtB family transcription factor [Acidimicrobiia bacterium]
MSRATTQARRLDACAHAMADPTRRRILHLVRDREVAAGELAAHFPEVSRPAVSQHLRVLARADLVTVRAEGNRRLYRTNPTGLAELRAFIEDMWGDGLGRLKLAAERAQPEDPT